MHARSTREVHAQNTQSTRGLNTQRTREVHATYTRSTRQSHAPHVTYTRSTRSARSTNELDSTHARSARVTQTKSTRGPSCVHFCCKVLWCSAVSVAGTSCPLMCTLRVLACTLEIRRLISSFLRVLSCTFAAHVCGAHSSLWLWLCAFCVYFACTCVYFGNQTTDFLVFACTFVYFGCACLRGSFVTLVVALCILRVLCVYLRVLWKSDD